MSDLPPAPPFSCPSWPHTHEEGPAGATYSVPCFRREGRVRCGDCGEEGHNRVHYDKT